MWPPADLCCVVMSVSYIQENKLRVLKDFSGFAAIVRVITLLKLKNITQGYLFKTRTMCI